MLRVSLLTSPLFFVLAIFATMRYVVSTILEEPLGCQNPTLISQNVADEVAKLKQGAGGDIVVSGRAGPSRNRYHREP
jgi:hypothetical protein